MSGSSGGSSSAGGDACDPSEMWWSAREWLECCPSTRPAEQTPGPKDAPNGWEAMQTDLIHRVLYVCKRELGSHVMKPTCRTLGLVNRHWHAALNGEVSTLQLRAGARPADVASLMRRFRWLDRLRLQRCGEGCLAAVGASQHPSLRVLDLQGCQEVTDAGLPEVCGLGRLQCLDLTNCMRVSDAGLRALPGLASLTCLNLRVGWSGKKAAPEAPLPAAFTREGFAALGRLSGLVELNLKGRKEVNDGMLSELRGLTSLAVLKLSSTSVTDRGLAVVAGLPSLASLTMACAGITDDGYGLLTALTGLTCLRVSNCLQMTDEGLVALGRITPLSKLLIGHAPMAMDAGLRALSQLVNLRALVLGYCGGVTAQGMRPLAHLPALSCVGFKRCPRVVRKELISLRAENPTFLKLKLFCH